MYVQILQNRILIFTEFCFSNYIKIHINASKTQSNPTIHAQINLIYSLQTDKYYNFVPKHEKPLYKTDVCYRKAT